MKALLVHPKDSVNFEREFGSVTEFTDGQVEWETLGFKGDYLKMSLEILVTAQSYQSEIIVLADGIGNEVPGCMVAIMLWKSAWIPIFMRSKETGRFEMVFPAIQTFPTFIREAE